MRANKWCGLLCLVVAVGCGSTPTRHYFTLSYPMDRDRVTVSRPALHPVRLRIKPFKVALPYDRPQIVYRQSLYEFQYYTLRLWASKPQHMIREIVQAHLESARLVSEITREYGDQMPDYELGGEVLAVEEYDSGDTWYGHLAIRLELVRFKDKAVIWHTGFDRKKKVFKKQPVYVVRAISAILEEEMNRVAAELDAVLSAERGVKATLQVPPPPSDEELPPAKAGGGQQELIVPEGSQPPAPPGHREELIVPEGD